jgi:branched-chain amino acid transport system permease protein
MDCSGGKMRSGEAGHYLKPQLSVRTWLIAGAVVLALHFLPWVTPTLMHLIIMMFLFAIMGQGWNILGGYAGQASFGHAVFYGTGAYVSTLLFIRLGISPWIGMLVAIAVGVALGLFIGFLSFRYGLKGPFFALIMLAFAEIFHMVAMGWPAVGGSSGLLIPLSGNSPLKMQFTNKTAFYFMTLWMLIGSIYLVWRLERSRIGLSFLAIREDHDAAEALGVDTFKMQMIAMALSAGITAMAGTVYAQYLLYIDPDSVFGTLNSVEIMLRPIIGGAGTVFGPLLGSLILTPLAEYSRLALQSYSGVYLMWYGVILIVVIIFLPNGVMGLFKSVWERFRRGGQQS